MSQEALLSAAASSGGSGDTPVPASYAPRRPHSLKALAFRGAAWTLVGYGGAQAIRFASNLVLARLLFPGAFGLMTIVNVLLQGIQMFSDVGIGPSIVQNPRGEERAFLNTAWTIQAVRGVILALACAVLAYPLSLFYEQPQLASILPVAGLTALVGGFNSTALVLANRRLALGRVTLLELATQAASAIVMIAWAWFAPSVWALVAGGIGAALLKMIGTHVLLPGPRCTLHWEKEAARALFRFGRWIFVSTLLAFCVAQGDRLIFGKFVSMEVLGVYGIALGIALLPQQIITRLFQSVLFPAYSRVADDLTALNRVFNRARQPLVIMAGALASTLLASGPWLIATLYDRRYHEAGWMLQIAAAGILFQSLECMNGSALLARGRSAAVAAGSAVKLVAMVVLVPTGWYLHAFPGALLGLAASDVCKYVVAVALLEREGIRAWRADLGIIAMSVVGAALGYLAAWPAAQAQWPNWVVATGAVLLGGLLWLPGAIRLALQERGARRPAAPVSPLPESH